MVSTDFLDFFRLFLSATLSPKLIAPVGTCLKYRVPDSLGLALSLMASRRCDTGARFRLSGLRTQTLGLALFSTLFVPIIPPSH